MIRKIKNPKTILLNKSNLELFENDLLENSKYDLQDLIKYFNKIKNKIKDKHYSKEIMETFNELIGGYGVKNLPSDNFGNMISIITKGDPYSVTILYSPNRGYLIGNWGDNEENKLKKRANPPKGLLSKAFTAKFEKYYEEAYDKYKDKKKASIIAWSRIKHRYTKSEKSGRWILKKK